MTQPHKRSPMRILADVGKALLVVAILAVGVPLILIAAGFILRAFGF